MASAVATGSELPTTTLTELTRAPKSTPSRGRMVKRHVSPERGTPAGTVVALKYVACSTPSLYQRSSLPCCASPSASA